MKVYDAVIIGAGSIGVPLSYYLARKGMKVAVIERLPSAGRGQNRAAIGGIRATHSDPAKIKICRRSLKIVGTFKDEYGYDVDWYEGGYLFPVYNEEHKHSLTRLFDIQHRYELNIFWAEKDDVLTQVPGLNPHGLMGGTFSPEDGSASPLKLIDAYVCLSRSSGVEFFYNEEVEKIEWSGGRVHSVKTGKGTYKGDLFIDASGADSRELNELIGLDIPVFPDSHEGGITEPVKRFFDPMIVDIRPGEGSLNFYFYQNVEGQIVFCITPDPPIKGKDIDNTSDFLPMVSKRMIQLYPRLRNIRVRRIWRGLYPMTPDGFPIVGWAPGYDNYFLMAGMCGQGFMLGPGLGEITADILADKSHDYDDILHQLKPDRDFTESEILK